MFSSRTFLTRFHEYSRKRRLIEERNTVIAAVSGGIDSVTLLDLLAKEQESLGLSIVVAHFNHQLRGEESDEDEAFVARRAHHYGFDFYVERSNTSEYARHVKLGIQEAARNLRYEFFDKLLVSTGADRIATAHNANDNAETILLNMFRGAGVQGLSGIPIHHEEKKIIRPLLFAQRDDIEAYVKQEMLEFRNDSSNEKDVYTRNFIRHNIVPQVQEHVNKGIVQTLHRSSELFRELEAFLAYTARQNFDIVAGRKTETELHLSIQRLRSSPVLLQQYIVMFAAEQMTHHRLEYEQVQKILELTEGLTGSWVSVSKEYVVFRDRENLVFKKSEPVQDFRIVVQPNHRYEFDQFRFSSQVLANPAEVSFNGRGGAEYVDADRIREGELVLRTWSEGDSFIPLGMKTRKKISDFFVDAKIPIYEKQHFPILETREGDVVWVCGQRIDDRFKITDDTKRVMKLEFTRATTRHDKQPT
jgi:tRNA(Ile)-lysidine synthase